MDAAHSTVISGGCGGTSSANHHLTVLTDIHQHQQRQMAAWTSTSDWRPLGQQQQQMPQPQQNDYGWSSSTLFDNGASGTNSGTGNGCPSSFEQGPLSGQSDYSGGGFPASPTAARLSAIVCLGDSPPPANNNFNSDRHSIAGLPPLRSSIAENDNNNNKPWNALMMMSQPDTMMHPSLRHLMSSSSSPPAQEVVSNDELVHISVRDLNQKLQGCDRQLVTAMKQKRRTLKNRGYALNCRVRRLQVQLQLEAENVMLKKETVYLRQQLADSRHRLDYYAGLVGGAPQGGGQPPFNHHSSSTCSSSSSLSETSGGGSLPVSPASPPRKLSDTLPPIYDEQTAMMGRDGEGVKATEAGTFHGVQPRFSDACRY